ncbi:MAG: Crp/Fnr family transcriptional regulator [Ilumatobacter sp.]|uniref:Crp/Fnr family transcriptional regulator n=1 Tax=Ilumatobacter sp. TaxID=1967498 RepID=UPI003299AF4B
MAIDLFGGLSDDDRRLVTGQLVRRSFAMREALFLQGDVGDSLHIIERGRVAVRTATPDGDELTLAVLGAGDFFGEQALINDDARRTASVVALDAVETRMLHRRAFDELCRTRPSVQGLLVRLLASQVRRLSEQMLEVLYVPVEDRVVRSLIRLTDLFDRGDGGDVDVPVRQEDLASLAGTTRPTANRVLKRLEQEGLIVLGRGRTRVVDPVALRALSPDVISPE